MKMHCNTFSPSIHLNWILVNLKHPSLKLYFQFQKSRFQNVWINRFWIPLAKLTPVDSHPSQPCSHAPPRRRLPRPPPPPPCPRGSSPSNVTEKPWFIRKELDLLTRRRRRFWEKLLASPKRWKIFNWIRKEPWLAWLIA